MVKVVVGLLLSCFLATFQLQAQETIQGGVRSTHAAFVENECPFDALDTPQVRCGMLTVPQDRSLPDGRQVQVAAAIFPAAGENRVADPLFYLDGGPGAASLQRWGETFNAYFSQFNQTRDVVILDYRGAGASEPSLYCDEVAAYYNETYGQAGDSEARAESYSDALNACRTRLVEGEHVDLGMYNSAVIAEDISDLRVALGYDEINLLGVSYGTRLALTILRDQPEGIRSAILDGVYPPQVNLSAETIPNMHRAFEELFNGCAADAECQAAFPNLREEFYATAETLNEAPIKLDVELSSYGIEYALPFDGNSFINYIFSSLYSTSLIPALPLIIHQAGEGNYEHLPRIVGSELNSDMSDSLGLRMAIQCTEEYPFYDVKEIMAAVEAVPTLSSFFIRRLKDDTSDEEVIYGCDAWSGVTPNPVENEAVESDVPVLILNGQFDPITPPHWGELASKTLTNSQSVTFPGEGHGAALSGSRCAEVLAGDFLAAPESRLDISCVEDTPIHWLTFDLSDSLADVRTALETEDGWEYVSDQPSVFWNYGMWVNTNNGDFLRVIDWIRSAFPVGKPWEEGFFSDWGTPRIEATCAEGDLQLYVITFANEYGYKDRLHYWLDMRDSEKVRTTFLSISVEGWNTPGTSSDLLFPELPRCEDGALLPAE